MPADGNTYAPTVRSHARNHQSVRTLFTTESAFDAELAGFDGQTEPGFDGGFSVVFDGRHSIPCVTLQGSDGEIEVTGWKAITQLCTALMEAEQMARRMGG